ncbi:putative family protein [Rosellinia necatrix]|uniref:Putative family protein n=1 Tax=Rosellinia necatrix TaxID=77044 RepID=A0A1W2TKQ1_ROSNE|nr:putative family protein [Rosellinia necatrix]
MVKPILVTGATGKQGGAVVNALLSLSTDEYLILAVTRDASTQAAKKLGLASEHIKVVQGNLDDVPSLFKEAQNVAGQPIWGVYSVQVSTGQGVTPEGEIEQGNALIDESIKAGVKHFVYSSVERGGDDASWENQTPVAHFQTKYDIEHHLRDITATGKAGENMSWTILRPVAFMDNLAPGFSTQVFLAAMRNWLGDKTIQWVATRDIGIFAAKSFADPKTWNRKAIGLAGDELNLDGIDKSFKKITGKPAPGTYWFLGSALTFMVPELRDMIRWFASDGYRADIKARRADYPELQTFEGWLDRESSFGNVE